MRSPIFNIYLRTSRNTVEMATVSTVGRSCMNFVHVHMRCPVVRRVGMFTCVRSKKVSTEIYFNSNLYRLVTNMYSAGNSEMLVERGK